MSIPRFLLSSSKQLRSTRQALTLLPRSVPSRTTQSASYRNSAESHSSRSWGAYVISAAVVGFAGLATFFHYNDLNSFTLKSLKFKCLGKGHANRPKIRGGPFTLTNTENQTVTERDFLGKWVLLYFGYTSSPDIGPAQLLLMSMIIDILESKHKVKVLPVFVSIDPQRDTPSQIRAYLKVFDSRIIGLTGPVAAVRQMAQEYHVYSEKVEEDGDDYLVDISKNLFFLNPRMEVKECFRVE
uniref:Thioredoxin domain-containing protein n=1 Tax=Lotus japonicus TaxID=34305 RepID=I3T743_LOTJA|nr:unknown [Lotus japonicus]